MGEPDFFSFLGGVPLANGRMHKLLGVCYDYFYPYSAYRILYINKNKIEKLENPASTGTVNPGWYYPDFRYINGKDARNVEKIIIPGNGRIYIKDVVNGNFTTYTFLDNFYETLLAWTELKSFFADEDVSYDENDVVFQVYQNRISAFFLKMFSGGSNYKTKISLANDYAGKIQFSDGDFYSYYEDFDTENLYIAYDPDVDVLKWQFLKTNIGGGCDYASVPDHYIFTVLSCEPHYKATNGFEIKDSSNNNLVVVNSEGNITMGYSNIPSASIVVNPASGSSKTYSFSNLELTEYFDYSPPSPTYPFTINPYHYATANWNIRRSTSVNESGYFRSASDNYIYPAKYKESSFIYPDEGDTMQIQSAIDDELWELSASSSGYTMYMTYKGSAIPEILIYDKFDDLPTTGDVTKVYKTSDDDEYYNWNGSVYIVTEEKGTRKIKLSGRYQGGGGYCLFYGYIFEASYENLTDSHSLSYPIQYYPNLYSYEEALVELSPLSIGEEATKSSNLVKFSERNDEEPDIQGNIEFNPDYSGIPYGCDSIVTVNYTGYTPVAIFQWMNIIDTIDTSSIVISGTLYGQTDTVTLNPSTLQTGGYLAEYAGRLNAVEGYTTIEETKRDATEELVIIPKTYSEILFDGNDWDATDFDVEETIDVETIESGSEKYYVLGGLNTDTNRIEQLERKYNDGEYSSNSIGAIINDYKISAPHITVEIKNFTCLYYMIFGENTTMTITFEGREIPESDLEVNQWYGFTQNIKYLYSDFEDFYDSIEIMQNGEAILCVEDNDDTFFVYTKKNRYTAVGKVYFLGNFLVMHSGTSMTFVDTNTWEENIVTDFVLSTYFQAQRYDGKYFYFFDYDEIGIVINKNFEITQIMTSEICEKIKDENSFSSVNVYGGSGGCLILEIYDGSKYRNGIYKNKRFNEFKTESDLLDYDGFSDMVDTQY